MAPPDEREWAALDAVKCRVDALADVIDAPSRALPTYGHSEDGARPHIEISPDGTLHRVVVERGQEIDRSSTRELDELLYWVFESVTHQMASDDECRHRRPDEDSRRQLFGRQLELLGRLSATWPARCAAGRGHLLDDAGLPRAEVAALTAAGTDAVVDAPERTCRIVLRRPLLGGCRDRWAAYTVEVDGRARGPLRPGRSLTVQLYPGRHRVGARIDWGRSRTVGLRLATGELTRLSVRAGTGPRRLRTGGWRGEPTAPYLSLETVGPVTLDD